MRHLLFLTASVLLSVGSVLVAGEVRTWRTSSAADFGKGTPVGVVVNNRGQVRLTRQVEMLADLDVGFVWDLAAGRDGAVYAATAEPAKVVRLGADGKATDLWAHDAGPVFSVAVGHDGNIYAGTGPDGTIYRIASDGTATEFFKTDAQYVWDLAFDPNGRLLAATGADGRIFRVDPGGKGTAVYDCSQPHVLCLAVAPDGTIYAGTDRDGLVYRIAPDGKAFVLYDAPQDEIRALCLAPDGTLYAGTASASAASATSSSSSSSSRSSTSSNSRSRSSSSSNEGNVVYSIGPDGTVRELFKVPAMIFALALRDATLLGGTGMSGVLYSLGITSGEQTEVARVDHEQVLSLLPRPDGSLVFGTGASGKFYRLGDGFAEIGTLTSEVFDAKLSSRWGAVRWDADLPPDTSLSLAVRTGNVAEPDKTWSDWSAEMNDAASANINCPAARFAQYRVTLKSSDPKVSPSLRRVSVRYLSANQAPELNTVNVPHVDEADGSSRQEKLRIGWTATDPNGDSLRYEVFFRRDGWPNWVQMADDVSSTSYDWDTTSVPEGLYTVRVVASDALDNPEGEALSDERVSEPFLVDHAAPEVTVRSTSTAQGVVNVEVLSKDPLTRLVGAAYSVDSQSWQKIYPKDGLFDSTAESFAFEVKDLVRGTHVLMVRTVDAAGNTGTDAAVFEIP